MSPPISFDGADVSGITIDGQDVSEVTVDGSVVWQANAIPDSVTNRWPTTAGSGTTLTDDIGTADGTTNGATWTASADAEGGYYLDYDGTDDFTEVSGDTVPSNALSVFAFVNVSATTSFQGVVARGNVAGGASDKDYELGLWDDGTIIFAISDGSSSFVNITGGGAAIPTDTWVLIAGTWDGSTAQTWWGTASNAVSEQANQSATGTPTDTHTLRHGGDAGATGRDLSGGLDAPGIADAGLTQSELQSILDQHPST